MRIELPSELDEEPPLFCAYARLFRRLNRMMSVYEPLAKLGQREWTRMKMRERKALSDRVHSTVDAFQNELSQVETEFEHHRRDCTIPTHRKRRQMLHRLELFNSVLLTLGHLLHET